ncbi:MAG: hypothetical protein HUK20_08905 [Fibrobacter sp.]|nr:hypothetical protein [Fibrobacter sp.]
MINASFTSLCIANGFGEGENWIATAMESAIEKIKVQKIPSPIRELSVYLSDGKGSLANSERVWRMHAHAFSLSDDLRYTFFEDSENNVKGNQALVTLTMA